MHTDIRHSSALTFVAEGDEVLVGRPGTDAYVVLSPDGAAAVDRLAAGSSPGEVADWYEAEFGEALDIEDFVAGLTECGLLPIGEVPIDEVPGRPVRWRRFSRALFSPVAALALVALLALTAALVAGTPRLLPHPGNVFFTRSALAVALVAMFGQLPLLFAHEAAHALAARRLGLPSKLAVSHRLYFLVFETRVPGLLGVPRRQRYLCFAAGMLCDVFVLAALTDVAWLTRGGSGVVGAGGRLSLALAYPLLIRLSLQFVLILQTDVYYMAATVLRCFDLQGVSGALIRNAAARVVRRPDRRVDLGTWTERDVAVARWYAPLRAAGVIVLVAVWAFGIIPVLVEMVRRVWAPLHGGTHAPDFLSSVAFLALTVGQLALLAVIGHRERAAKRRALAR